jgi:hypothetical protein
MQLRPVTNEHSRMSPMTTRRSFLGLVGISLLCRTGWAQQGNPPQDPDELRNRGRPTGRVGAATRGAQGDLALELVAPMRGVGLTRLEQPRLYFLLSGTGTRPVRLVISTAGQPQPLIDREMSSIDLPALGAVDLRSLAVRLSPNLLHTWSVVVTLDPRSPSRDLIANALVQYRPADLTLERAVREAPMLQRYKVLADAGYWYDAVAMADDIRTHDNGAALAELLDREALRSPPIGLASMTGTTRYAELIRTSWRQSGNAGRGPVESFLHSPGARRNRNRPRPPSRIQPATATRDRGSTGPRRPE